MMLLCFLRFVRESTVGGDSEPTQESSVKRPSVILPLRKVCTIRPSIIGQGQHMAGIACSLAISIRSYQVTVHVLYGITASPWKNAGHAADVVQGAKSHKSRFHIGECRRTRKQWTGIGTVYCYPSRGCLNTPIFSSERKR